MASLPLLGFADGDDTIVGARSAIVFSMMENGARDCASRHDAPRIRPKLHTFNGRED
jgi:hypothetical protein